MSDPSVSAAASAVPAGLAEPAFDANAMRVLKERYFAKKADGTAETPKEFLWRVASSIAKPERRYATKAGKNADAVVDGVSHAFYDMMCERDFLPNTPCLVNAGRPLSMLSACFVLPVPDSIEGIFYNLKAMALIQKSGGGCVSADSRVWTTFCGLEPIEVLFNRATIDGRSGIANGNGTAYDVRDLGIRTVSMDASNGKTALRDVTHVWKFDVPAESQIVVRTREGTEVQTSAWHPFMVLRGREFVEVRADALTAGDIVLGPDRPDEFWPWDTYRTVSGLEIDEEIGWLIGFTLGDGSFGYVPSLRQERLRWFSGTIDVLDRVRAILRDRGINVGINRDPREETRYVSTLTQEFVTSMLAACGFIERGPKDQRIRIPEHIAKSPLSVVRAFVAGLLDSDGTVDADGSPSYTTASSAMAHDLAALLSLLGYRPTLHRKEPHGRGKVPTYTVLLCPLPQVSELAGDVAGYMSSTLRKERLHSDSRVQTGLGLPFAAWRDELFELGLVRSGNRNGPGPLADELNRWSCNPNRRVRRDDLHAIARELKPRDAAAGDLLESLARRGQEIESVERAAVAMPYYDLTVEGWNTYASGRTGLALIHNTGFSFSDLRHQGAEVFSTGKDASGPVSFMKVFNAATDSIKQGGVRRGANMGVLRVDHPDVYHFMSCKKELDAENRALWNRMSDTGRYSDAQLAHMKQELLQTQINNFNISIGVTDAFMSAVRVDGDFDLRDPRTKEIVRTVKAREIWDAIVEGAWQNGEPGVLFLDHPDVNPLPGLGAISATNPCGEQFLHGNDSCNLGSINVGNFFDERSKSVDWDRLERTTALAIRFLDNVIDANIYPIDEIREMVTNNRRVGLGIMGFAELLIRLEIPYGSDAAIVFAGELMEFMQRKAIDTSETLALERGNFPNKHLSIWADDARPRRNAALLSIAPTGTISMIAGCAFGCEPFFGMAYTKHVMKDAEGRPQHLYYVVPLFEEIAKREGFFSDALLGEIEENRGSLKGLGAVPEHWQHVFTTSADVTVDEHIDMLAAFQKNTCNAVSKCVAAGTLIPTDKGLVPIEELGEAPVGEFGVLNDEYQVVGHDGVRHRITGFFNNGRVPTVKIRMANGASFEASETHHVLTLNGWKSMTELHVDDLVVGRFEEISGEGSLPIEVDFPVRFSKTYPTFPTRMSSDLALWLGMVAADGHTVESSGNVGLSEKDELGEVAACFDRLCVGLFGLTPRVVTDKRTGVRTRSMTSRALVRYVESLIGKGARSKRVPEQILRGSSDERIAFLNGVTLDGYTTRGTLVIYSGISEPLVTGLEAIARSLGAPSCYRWTERKSGGYLVHQLRASGDLQALLQPVESRKRVAVPPASGQHLVRTPKDVFDIDVPYKHAEFSNLRSLKERRPATCRANTLVKLEIPLSDRREYLVRIASIERSEAQTFDIEVADVHSYVVNGIVSHNTINAPNDDTRENVARAIFRAYDAGCKGFTYYRDGSRTEQVVTFSKDNDLAGGNRDIATAPPTAALPVAAASPAGTTGGLVSATPTAGTNAELDIAALLAKANALLEVR